MSPNRSSSVICPSVSNARRSALVPGEKSDVGVLHELLRAVQSISTLKSQATIGRVRVGAHCRLPLPVGRTSCTLSDRVLPGKSRRGGAPPSIVVTQRVVDVTEFVDDRERCRAERDRFGGRR